MHGTTAAAHTNKEFKKTKALELYLKNYTQAQICDELASIGHPADVSSVSRYLKECREEWKETRLDNMEEVLDRELAALADMERSTSILFDKFNPTEAELDMYSNSREAVEWVKARLKIMEMRHKLMSLYKPMKLEINSKNENVNINAEQSNEIRREILSRLSPNSDKA